MADAVTEPVEAPCPICTGRGPWRHVEVRERMFGWPERFDYRLCADCGCLQLVNPPADLSRYYGPGYYSFGVRRRHRGPAAWLVAARNRHLVGDFHPVGAWLARRRPFLGLAALRALRLPREARIVDVGCGSGELLLALRSAGFRRIVGVDAFVAGDLDLGQGVRVRRGELASLAQREGPFDLVMFHHSLEHVADPVQTLAAAFAALRPGGRCLVRIPTVSSFAWRSYGVDWCALDAPRHLWLHSRGSIRRLAERCGFAVLSIDDDSTTFQFWGSEQYRRGVPLMRPGCHDIVPAPGQFSESELAAFAARAAELNAAHDGDQIVVLMQRP